MLKTLGNVKARQVLPRLKVALLRHEALLRDADCLLTRQQRVRELRDVEESAERLLKAMNTYTAGLVASTVDMMLDPNDRGEWLAPDEHGDLQPVPSESRFVIPISDIWEARTLALAGQARRLLKTLPPRPKGPQWRLFAEPLEAEVAVALYKSSVSVADTNGGPLDVCLRVTLEAAGFPHASRKRSRRRCVAFIKGLASK